MAIVHKIMHAKGQLDHTCWFEKAGNDKGATGSSADPLMLKVIHGRSVLSRNLRVRVVDA